MRNNKSCKRLHILLSLMLSVMLFLAFLCGCSTRNIDISSDAVSDNVSSPYEKAEEHVFGSDDYIGDGNDIEGGENGSSHIFGGEQSRDDEAYSGEINSGEKYSSIPPENNTIENSQTDSGSAPRQEQGQSEAGYDNNTAAVSQSDRNEQSDNAASDNVPDKAQTTSVCSFLVDCSKALEYEKLSPSIRAVLPANGIIYSGVVEFTPGESVFDVMSRVLRENGIPMESSVTPGFGSRYIEGINSLYEFDGGSNSGWVYFVNGSMPSHGCDLQTVSNGDDIRWYYTLNLGYDISL